MDRFTLLFEHLNQQSEGAFVPFTTLCDPDFNRSFDIICTFIENGADALELGFPFSDPLLDGPVIQAANQRALSAGFSSESSFQLIAKIRSRYPNIPISLLLCANLIYAQTLDNFYQRCQTVGVDAVLVADIPILESSSYISAAKKHGIQPVFICPPNADNETIKAIAEKSEGYVYLVSRAGVTSADNQTYASNLDELISQLKFYNNRLAVLQGFGIATPEQVAKTLALGADGAISGSAISRIIEENLNNHATCLAKLATFVRNMKQATLSR